MARLIYSAIMSLDGYVADQNGNFDWAAPSEEVFRFVNELERPIGTYLFGRRMYETLAVWDSPAMLAQDSAFMRDFAKIWQAADKIVYSRSLAAVATARTRLERRFDPQAVQALKSSARCDLAVGGSELAGQAITAGLVDELQVFLCPIVVGGGTSALSQGARIRLELEEQRRFSNGVVFLRYRVSSPPGAPP